MVDIKAVYGDMPMEEIHAHVLGMLKVIHRICKREEIGYFMQAGTLLGSVREGGFIPWDDDADIMMHRDDYDRFEACCGTELEGEGYYLNYTDRVPKVCLLSQPHVHVDIFTIDLLPAGSFQKKYKLLMLKLLQGMAKEDVDYSNYSLLGKLQVFVTSAVGRLFSNEKKLELYRKMSVYGSNEKSTAVFWSNDLYRFIHYEFDRDYWRETEEMPFEDTTLNAPKHWDIYLRICYGDNYMEPVKEDFYTYKKDWKE